jgi:hypothetical protein
VADEILQVHPHCLMFFVDDTGHEDFADPNFPVFGLGGCALLPAAIDQNLRQPWRRMKERHFGGLDVPLHASELRSPSRDQLAALAHFFREQVFGRFAVTMTTESRLPIGICARCRKPPRRSLLATGRTFIRAPVPGDAAVCVQAAGWFSQENAKARASSPPPLRGRDRKGGMRRDPTDLGTGCLRLRVAVGRDVEPLTV